MVRLEGLAPRGDHSRDASRRPGMDWQRVDPDGFSQEEISERDVQTVTEIEEHIDGRQMSTPSPLAETAGIQLQRVSEGGEPAGRADALPDQVRDPFAARRRGHRGGGQESPDSTLNPAMPRQLRGTQNFLADIDLG